MYEWRAGFQIAGNGEERLPQILDEYVAIFLLQRPVERLVIDEAVTRNRRAAERAIRYKDIVRSLVNSLGLHAIRQRSGHRRANASSPEDIELGAGFPERFIGPEMCAPKRPSATCDKADCSPR